MVNQKQLRVLLPLILLLSLTAIQLIAQPSNPMQPRAGTLHVSAGGYHTCAIRPDETLRCWGYNIYGQSTVPADLGKVKAVSAGFAHTCIIRTDETLHCWGWDSRGQSTVAADLGPVKMVSAGGFHTCAIRPDESLACWGDDEFGQSVVPADLDTVKAVSVGHVHTCTIRTDETLRCWGDNFDGQSTVPADLGTVKAVSTGHYHTCAIRTDDSLRCWGNNDKGQSMVPADLGTVKAVSAGLAHTCALQSDDTLICWGDDEYGQSPVPDGMGIVKTVSAGREHTCAIRSDNSLICWGLNSFGQSTVPQPILQLQSPVLILQEGDSTVIRLNASDYPWTNVLISIGYSGTAIRNSDYTGEEALVLDPLNQFTELIISVQEDNEDEGDESLLLEIVSIVGGTEDGTQQVILTIQDKEGGTPTATPDSGTPAPTSTPDSTTPTATPNGGLLVNTGFESALSPWMVKSGIGDKLKCNKDGKPPVARSGNCAFQFKGGVGEGSKLEQSINLAAQTWAAGDTLNLSAYVKATNPAASGTIKVRVKYSDNTEKGKIDANIVPNTEYTELTGSYTLLSPNVSKIKVQVQHKSTAGKVLIDDTQLLYTAAGTTVLPLP